MPRLRPATALLGFLGVMGAGAVASPGCATGVPCALNSDCIVGVCRSGTCQKQCADAALDCPQGYSCNTNAQCVPPSSARLK